MPLWTAGIAVLLAVGVWAVLTFGQSSCYRRSRADVVTYVGAGLLVLAAGGFTLATI